MNDFLDYIEKYKFAIFGTLFLHILIFLFSVFTTVKDVDRMIFPEISMEIPLDDIEFEPEIEELLELNKEPLPSENMSNLVSDSNDDRETSYEDYSENTADMSEEAMMSAKELEAKYFKEAAENNDRTDVANSMDLHELNETENNDQTNSKTTDKAYAGSVMIDYDLDGRKHYSLPNPGYTCNGSGVVVIQIKVDKTGSVKDATFLTGPSNGATDCMIGRAIRYAKKSRFDYVSNTSIQTGTITYKFLGK